MTWATAGLGWPAVTPLMRDMEMGPAGLQQDYSRTTAGQRGSSGVQLTLLLHQSNQPSEHHFYQQMLDVSARKIILPNFRYQIRYALVIIILKGQGMQRIISIMHGSHCTTVSPWSW